MLRRATESADSIPATVDRPRWSNHAARRWMERFPDLAPAEEWASAMTASGRVGKSRRARIRQQCRVHAAAGEIAATFRGVYYRVSAKGVVFVVAPGYRIVTVFPLGTPLSPSGVTS